jgi:hypothetical protein
MRPSSLTPGTSGRTTGSATRRGGTTPDWISYPISETSRPRSIDGGFLIPFVCYYLDELDLRHWDTLGYKVIAQK